MKNAIDSALDNDLIILSDNDEIPNLRSEQFKKDNNKILIFEQLFFYYKFNLLYDRMSWFGSKACKKKYLKSFSWLRNQKNKKYPFWRVDTYFSKLKNTNLRIIKDGGWHFTNIKSPEDIEKKLLNYTHHDEFTRSKVKLEDLKKKIKEKKIIYDHSVDQTKYKWDSDITLSTVKLSDMPDYLRENYKKYVNWLEI
jgi:beta-1,4-mannosyl-glycoprotein beta-1,4-N-acetylglucosaminyltransferase